jgi:hypothetical protein
LIHKIDNPADITSDCDREVGIMRISALVLVLLSSVIGFVMSYGFAYQKVTGVLYSSAATMQSSTVIPSENR